MVSSYTIQIGGREIGVGRPALLIAEAGVNHNGDLGAAKQLVDVAAHAGADAIKFQTFRAEALVTSQAPKAKYQIQSTGNHESQLEMIKRLELPADAYRELRDRCRAKGIIFLSTPFDFESADCWIASTCRPTK